MKRKRWKKKRKMGRVGKWSWQKKPRNRRGNWQVELCVKRERKKEWMKTEGVGNKNKRKKKVSRKIKEREEKYTHNLDEKREGKKNQCLKKSCE